MKLAVLGVFEGDVGIGDAFRPNDTMTRAEFAKTVCYLKGLTAQARALEQAGSKFTDVSAYQWYTGWINSATAFGYFIGGYDGTFRPDDLITMNEIVTVALRCVGYNNLLGVSTGRNQWPDNYVNKAKDFGMLDELDFEGDAPASRADAAIICNAILEITMVAWINPDLALAFPISPGTLDPDGFTKIYYLEQIDDQVEYIKAYECILHKSFTYYSTDKARFVLKGESGKADYGANTDFPDSGLAVRYDIYGKRKGADISDKQETITILKKMKLAEKYYICGGFIWNDLPGKEAKIIYNADDELVYIEVVSEK